MKNSFFIGAIVTVATSQASAHHREPCLIDSWDVLQTQTQVLPGCQLTQPLALIQSEGSFPKMENNPWPVRIWQGRYERNANVTKTVRHTLYDRCRGLVVSQNDGVDTSIEPLVFDVENPNLDPGIETTIELAPMTDAEAQAAFLRAKVSCQTYSESGS